MEAQQFVDSFVKKYLGRSIEYHSFNPNAKNQCVDLVNKYINDLGLTTTIGTNAKDFPYKVDKQQFEVIAYKKGFKPQVGDIAVWNKKVGGGAGHIAIVKDDKANSRSFNSIDQNWSKKQVTTLESHSYANITHFIRPVMFTNKQKDTMPEETKMLLKKYGAKTIKELDEIIYKHVGLSWGSVDDPDNKSMLANSRRKNGNLRDEIKQLHTEIDLLDEETSTLGKQVAAQKGQVTKKEKEIEALKAELVEAQKPNIVQRFTSRKFLLAIAGFAVPILNELLGINLSIETMVVALTSLIAFLGVEGYTDHVVRVANEVLEKPDESNVSK